MLKITEYAQRLIDDLDERGLHRAGEDPAEELDRPLHRRGGRPSTPPQGDEHRGLHHPPGHPLRRHLYGPLPGARPTSSKWAGRAEQRRRRQRLPGEAAARKSDFERTELDKEKTGVKLEGVQGDQPGERQGDPHLHLRLRSGRPTAPAPSWPCPPTTTATGSLPRSSAARSSRWSGGERRARRKPLPPRTTPASWSTPTSSTA